MQFECFILRDDPAELVPGRPQRDWMNAFIDRHPYRCLPLTMANTSGWELLCPVGLTATWNGGPAAGDITVTPDDCASLDACLAGTHFGGGVLTFHTGYLFRTPPGWSLRCGGPPNQPKHGLAALEGVVETDWLPFPFTMNWMFTAPGSVRFEKGEAFCFFSPVQDKALEAVQPVTEFLGGEPDLRDQFIAWAQMRQEFSGRLLAGDPEASKQAWQKLYFQGQTPAGSPPAPGHVTKRGLKPPVPRG